MNLVERLRDLRGREHDCTVDLVASLVECYRERVYLEYGCSSLFEFLVEELHYSHAAASRRYRATKVAARCPRALELLREHRVSLCTLSRAESLVMEVAEPEPVLDRICGMSSREVEKFVAQQRPVEQRPREVITPVAVRPPRAGGGGSNDSGDTPLLDAAPGSGPAEGAESDDVPVVTRISIRTTLSEEEFEQLERVWALVSRKIPGARIEDVLVELMAFYLKHKAPRERNGSAPAAGTRSRHIPRSVRDAVMIRDGHQCTFVGRNGRRCGARHNLHIDHVRPWALGGTHDPENLRVLCAAHNRQSARETFGRHKAEGSGNSPIAVSTSEVESEECPNPGDRWRGS